MGDADETFLLRRSIQLAWSDQDTLLKLAARRTREAQHEVATAHIIQWCSRNVERLGNVWPALGRELEELLERHEATRPEVES